MDGEIKNFIKVWILAIISLCYCYYIAARIPRGVLRFLSLTPIFYLFIILPLNLSTIHLGGSTALFLVWLANFKLLLFSFDQGPLSLPPPKLSHFISIACLPIKVKQHPPTKPQVNPRPTIDKPLSTKNNTNPSHQNTQTPQRSSPNVKLTQNPSTHYVSKVPRSILLAIKFLLLGLIFHTYNYRQYLHQYVVFALYFCHIYLELEIALALCATLVRAIFGFELEPQFNEPYLATSLQDFWGHRWNLVVSSILRPTVYNPIRRISTRIIGHRWVSLPAVIATFVVSGIMHEVLYYYLTRVHPTGEVMCFFVLHGVCTAVEVAVKKAATDKWRLHRVVSRQLTVGFVAVTGVWLFLPQLLRNGVDEKTIREVLTFGICC